MLLPYIVNKSTRERQYMNDARLKYIPPQVQEHLKCVIGYDSDYIYCLDDKQIIVYTYTSSMIAYYTSIPFTYRYNYYGGMYSDCDTNYITLIDGDLKYGPDYNIYKLDKSMNLSTVNSFSMDVEIIEGLYYFPDCNTLRESDGLTNIVTDIKSHQIIKCPRMNGRIAGYDHYCYRKKDTNLYKITKDGLTIAIPNQPHIKYLDCNTLIIITEGTGVVFLRKSMTVLLIIEDIVDWHIKRVGKRIVLFCNIYQTKRLLAYDITNDIGYWLSYKSIDDDSYLQLEDDLLIASFKVTPKQYYFSYTTLPDFDCSPMAIVDGFKDISIVAPG